MKRFQNEFFYLELLKASIGPKNRSMMEQDYKSEFESEEAVHALLLQHDNYVDDLETVASGYEGVDDSVSDFQFLEASFVQDVWFAGGIKMLCYLFRSIKSKTFRWNTSSRLNFSLIQISFSFIYFSDLLLN